MEASKIQGIMDRLDKLPYRKFLFSGPWGVGKTKHITDAIKDNENIYYISLFGKNDINTFYEELYYILLSKSKVRVQKVLKYMKNINFSHSGFNISIPYMSDVLTTIQKELKSKSDITIIIDDLERKSDRLEIKEIFGFVDSITKNEGIKIVLVASIENLSNIERDAFDDYAEKSIDRIYEITKYADDAPRKIMGESIWNSVKPLYINHQITNLRTLEKIKNFVVEVVEQVPEDIFNKKINKEDIYKICASVIIFVVDHHKKKVMLKETENDNITKNKIHNVYISEENYSNYIWHYILEGNLENSMMHILIPIVLQWFETGDFNQEELNSVLEQVDLYEETTIPLFMSDSQIEKELDGLSSFISNLDKNISLKGIMQRLDELASIAEKTNLKFAYSIEEVVAWILENTSFDHSIYNHYFDFLTRRNSDFINKVVAELNVKSMTNYNEQIISKMILNVDKRIFIDDDSQLVKNFKQLYDTLKSQGHEQERKTLISKMIESKWLLPLPYSEITDEHWSYCHNILQCIAHIDNGEDKNIKANARQYFNEKISESSDEIFKYRMKSLMQQYLEDWENEKIFEDEIK